MRRKFSEEQIISFLQQEKDGISVSQICRDNKVSIAAFYRWRAKFGGMNVAEAKQLRLLELENTRLKRKIIEQARDLKAIKDLLAKNW